MLSCGRASVRHVDDEEGFIGNYPKTKKTKKNLSLWRIGKDYTDKNPYANRGLDKFNALLAELDDMRQKIYAQMGFEEVSFVQFEYSNDSKDIKPIVVKVKDMIPDIVDPKVVKNSNNIGANNNTVIGSKETGEEKKQEPEQENDKDKKKACVSRCKGRFKLEYMRQTYLFPVIVILILFLLAIFGRTFAILCISIAWYLIPVMNIESSNSSSNKRPKSKKSETNSNGMKTAKSNDNQVAPTSPTSVINGLNKSPNKQGRSEKTFKGVKSPIRESP